MKAYAAIALLAATQAAAAGPLSVTAPGSFVVEPVAIAQDSLFTEQLGISAPADGPQPVAGQYLCTVGYFPPMPGEVKTQEQYNAELLNPQFIATIKSNLANGMSAVEQSDFRVAEAAGLEFIGTPKDNANHRYYMAMWQMPVGNVQTSCSTTADRFEEALAVFRSIRDSVVAPD